jgi:hypothetical protein
MIRKLSSAIIATATLIGAGLPVRAASLQYNDAAGIVARRWVASPIIVAFSTSLNSPPANIKAGSDVVGAAHRALQHWAAAADIQFLEVSSTTQTVSPQNARDGISLISVSADNGGLFNEHDGPGRTRVFYDSGGAIVEADIALNPKELFSSDATDGTYDLEGAFAHEIGHLLGLEHSAVIGATMQPRQAKNGLYGMPALTQRTLADDDRAGVRALYGPRNGTGSIVGRLTSNEFARARTVFGGHVVAEDVATGRVMAGSITLAGGEYRLEGLAPGSYRLIGQSLNGLVAPSDIAAAGGSYLGLIETTPSFRTFVGMGPTPLQSISVGPNAAVDLPFFVFSNPGPSLKPRVIGMNGELSTAALPLTPGKTFTIYVGGEGIDQIPANGISISSPLMTVNAASLEEEDFDTPYPVISFAVTLAPEAAPGDYSIRLQLSSGEFAYLAGAITIDPVNTSSVTF